MPRTKPWLRGSEADLPVRGTLDDTAPGRDNHICQTPLPSIGAGGKYAPRVPDWASEAATSRRPRCVETADRVLNCQRYNVEVDLSCVENSLNYRY